MQPLLALLGCLILIAVLVDVLWTTMGEGGGPLTTRVLSGAWSAFLGIHRRYGPTRLFSFAGIIIVMLAIGIWILLLWTGWTLIFCGSYDAVLEAQTRMPADFWERMYFTGFTIFTLGVGDFVAGGDLWRVLSAIASVNGLFVVTFSVTYLVPIVQAATQKRQLAVYIFSIGRTAEEIVLHTWNGSNCQPLGQHLATLTPELTKLGQRHLSYPVLHYFQSRDQIEAEALSVAALDEALTIVEHGIRQKEGPCMEAGLLHPARRVITQFLRTLNTASIEPAEESPPPPSLASLREQGLPVANDDAFRARVERLSERRRLLLALVENDGWTWEMLQPGEQSDDGR